ncbi:MAG: Rieske (2Fe-2S) protein [Blastocatellales bacterium]
MNLEGRVKSYRKVAKIGDVPFNGGLKISIEEEEIALFNLGGEFYAINDCCPHRGASLNEGFLDQDSVLCPLHCFDFNLKTGESKIASHLRVATYPIKIEDGCVFILY